MSRSLLLGILVLTVLVDGVHCRHGASLEADRPRRGDCVSKSKARKDKPGSHQLESAPAKPTPPAPAAPRAGSVPNASGGAAQFGSKSAGAAERLLHLGDGVKVGAATFHSRIKPAILRAAGKFEGKVGKNPDIKVVGGRIQLQGVGPFKGKTFKTELKASDFFNLD